MSADGSRVYFALQDVPAGVELTDAAYWKLQVDLSATKAEAEAATAAANAAAETANTAAANVKGDIDRLSEEKLDNYRLSINRLSSDGEMIGYALEVDTGEVYQNEYTASFRVSDFCDVATQNPHETVTVRGLTGTTRICFYDNDKNFISGLQNFGSGVPITLPDGTKYARVQSQSDFTAAFINIGSDTGYHEPGRTEVVIPAKTSDLENDEQYFSAKVNGAIKARHVDFSGHSTNLLDESKIVDGYYVGHYDGELTANSAFKATEEYVDISKNNGSIVILTYLKTSTDINLVGSFHRCAFYDANKTFISGLSNGGGTSDNLKTCVVTVPEGAVYIRCGWSITPFTNLHMIAYGDNINIPYDVYDVYDANPKTVYDMAKMALDAAGTWSGKTWVSYGDSITAQGNDVHDYGYQYYVDEKLGFAESYRRGVGGQTYKANAYTFYANADGSYAGRYGQGGLTEAPEGTTTHLGYLASWDRITAMIPENIRESVDLVVLCSGTNDHASVEDVETDGVIDVGVPAWVANSTADAEWAAASDYAGGDYDISTFVGAIASTIMKMRIWCPNAVVVLATPYPRWDTATMQQYTNNKGLDFREMCEIQIATAKYMSCPVCDANALSGISAANFAGTVSDGVHPNAAGMKLYGKALADCLNDISPKII